MFSVKMLFHASLLVGIVSLAAANPIGSPVSQSVTPVRRQAASLCSQYAYYAANGYEFNNNNWGKGSASSGSQCTTVQSTSGSGVSWSTSWTWQGGQDNVKSYANVGKQFARGIKVKNVKSMPTNIQWDCTYLWDTKPRFETLADGRLLCRPAERWDPRQRCVRCVHCG
jgi:xyloglucan-specific endo-beta-1,4-glucanase